MILKLCIAPHAQFANIERNHTWFEALGDASTPLKATPENGPTKLEDRILPLDRSRPPFISRPKDSAFGLTLCSEG
jgi:hypothetical protein